MAVKLMPVAQVGPVPTAPADPVEVQEKPREPRKRRRAAVYDADGHEVLITLKCLKCNRMHPLSNFGLRKMADGAIRNQPWCRDCRGASSPKKKKSELAAEAAATIAAEPAEVLDQPVPVAPPVGVVPTQSGPMQVMQMTAEQVMRALAPQLPSQPAVTETPEPPAPTPEVEPKPE